MPPKRRLRGVLVPRGPEDIASEGLRVDISKMYLARVSIEDIAAHYEKDNRWVYNHLRDIRALWRESAAKQFGERQAEELARIDRMEEEYWVAWEKSKVEKKRRRGQAEVNNWSERAKHAGNPKFLDGIQWCIDQRCKILGLHAPKEIAMRHLKEGDRSVVEQLSEVELKKIIASAVRKTSEVVDAEYSDSPPEPAQLPQHDKELDVTPVKQAEPLDRGRRISFGR